MPFEWFVALRYLREGRMQTALILGAVAIGVAVVVFAGLPADRILVETDAPFLAPIPFRGKRNEPSYVTHTAAFLAKELGMVMVLPMYEIVRMPGFNRLDPKIQEEILNDPKNFWALDSRVNASKGHRSLTEWRGHPDAAEFPRIDDKKFGDLLTKEKAARDYLRTRISELAGDSPAPKPDAP